MATIYLISVFVLVYYFGIGYKRFQTSDYPLNKISLTLIAILLRLVCLKLIGIEAMKWLSLGVDLIIGFSIYKLARNYYDEQKSLVCASFYLLNPVIVIYSCVRGGMLSVWLLLILLVIICIQQRKIVLACIFFSVCQYYYIGALFLLPLFIGIIIKYIKEEQKLKRFGKVLGGLGIPLIALVLVDYLRENDLTGFVYLKQFIFSKYMAYNACNLWSMVGWNWKPLSLTALTKLLLFCDYAVALILVMAYLEKKWKSNKLRDIYIALLMSFYGYCFGIGISSDFFLVTVFLALLCFLWSGYKKTYWMYVGVSAVGFCQQVYAYSLYKPEAFNSQAASIILFSFFTLVSLVIITRWLFKDTRAFLEGEKNLKLAKAQKIKESSSQEVQKEDKKTKCDSKKTHKLELKDYITMGMLTLVFTVLSLPTLGSHHTPQTSLKLGQETTKEIIVDLGEEKQVEYLDFFLGQEHDIKIFISRYDEKKGDWQVINENQSLKSVFAWNKVEVKTPMRYLGIVISNEEAYLNELAIIDDKGALIIPVDTTKYKALFDEQDLYKTYPTYYDQTFFDEVYHARTAYEYIMQDTTYETTHPPLGKILISLGIRVFGMNPFGWRIVVEIFGILMIPLIYLFAKRLFKDYWVTILTTLLLTMDFMHFTLAKIATLDIIIGFFILLMYYFMYRYYQIDFIKAPLRRSFVPLGLCGITMGLGIASKWTGVYAGAGLAILFFSHMWQAYQSYAGEKREILKKISKTCAFCIVFFVMIPIGIYCLSYIPFVGYRDYNGLLDKVLDNMQYMYNYHSQLKTTHPFESQWYEWAWMKRPLYQAVTHRIDGMGSAISCFGNPLVWWPGILAVFYTFKCWLWDKDKQAGFLCISYATQLVPWCFVTRSIYIYHYFPCSLFTILCSGYCMQKIVRQYKHGEVMIAIYGISVILIFMMFYPVISGMWINEETARLWLRWLSGWVII